MHLKNFKTVAMNVDMLHFNEGQLLYLTEDSVVEMQNTGNVHKRYHMRGYY